MRTLLSCFVIGLSGIVTTLPNPALAEDAPASTANELSAQMNGLSLPEGFQHMPHPVGPNGEVAGIITGPDGLEIGYSVLPLAEPGETPDDSHFSSDVERLKKGQHQWHREQYVGDELVQLGLSPGNFLVVSFPQRGINMNGRVNGLGQLSDALIVVLSIPNKTRRLSWEAAKKLIEQGDVVSVVQYHSRQVVIRTADETEYRTLQPQLDDVIKLIRALGKSDKIAIATE